MSVWGKADIHDMDLACLAKVFLHQESFWVIPLTDGQQEPFIKKSDLLVIAAFDLDAKS